MASFTVSYNLSGLRRGLRDLVNGPGNQMQLFLQAARQLASERLRDSPELRYSEATSRLKVCVTIEDGFADGATDADDPDAASSTLVLATTVLVDEDALYNYGDPDSAVGAFVEELGNGLAVVAGSLPNGGQDFFAALGITDPSEQIYTKLSVQFGTV